MSVDVDAPDWLALEPGERIRWSGGPRVQLVGIGVAIGLLVGVAPSLVPSLPSGLAILGFIPPVLVYLWVRNTTYVVTTEGLYRKSGIVSRRVIAVDLETVQNVSYSQSITGTLLDHGTIDVETAGSHGTELSYRYVDDPRTVHRLVEDVLSERHDERHDRIPGSVEQWTDVLNEVRKIRSIVDDRSE